MCESFTRIVNYITSSLIHYEDKNVNKESERGDIFNIIIIFFVYILRYSKNQLFIVVKNK